MCAPDTDESSQTGCRGLAILSAIFVCLLVVCPPAPASATVMEYADLPDLVKISDVIVRAEVTDRRSFHDDDRQRILTHTTFEVKESYAEEVGDEVTVEQWGGTVDGETTVIPGDARFQLGEEVILFLRHGRTDRDVLFLSALAQSKYTIYRDGDATLVARDLSNLEIVREDDHRQQLRISGQASSLEAFVTELRSLLGSRKGAE